MKLLDWYRQVYRPARHPGDSHRSTVETYEFDIKKFDRYMREHRGRDAEVDDLTDENLCGAMSWMIDSGLERSTANKFLRTLNALWRFAHRRKLLLTEPDNDKLRVDGKDPIAFLPDEKHALLDAAPLMPGTVGPQQIKAGRWWLGTLLMCFSFGPRITSLRFLPSENLDLVRGEVLLPSGWHKGRKEQRRDLYPSCTAIWRELDPAGRGLKYVLDDFADPRTGRRFCDRTFNKHFRRIHVLAGLAKKPADVPDYWLSHCIRKTVASEIYAVAGIHVACEVLGHSSIEVTKRYIDPRYTSQIRVRDLLDDPIGAPPDPRPLFRIYRPEAS
ncbi:MAG: tyrosine-type recombinase/integrase [Pirellulales bacterium]